MSDKHIVEVQGISWNLKALKGWNREGFIEFVKKMKEKGTYHKRLEAGKIYDTLKKELDNRKAAIEKTKEANKKKSDKKKSK